jgi:uncharacterized protein YecE (DUF72 family)
MEKLRTLIKVGTSGFSFKDWKGPVYPQDLKPGDTLRYYEEQLGFDTVEINSTYYALVSDKSFSGMADKTSAGFDFVVKAYRGITHDPFDSRLGENRPSFGKAEDDAKKFVYSIQPLKAVNKLGAVLLQFPVFFHYNEESKEYILRCGEWFEGLPLVIEFRNRSWAGRDTIEFLRKNGMGYCAVDEPKLERLMPFVNEVTSGIGYVRFHGRNPNWFNAPITERYNYMYSEEELKSFVPELKKISEKAKKTYAFFNNCHAGSAAKNARAIKELLLQTGD